MERVKYIFISCLFLNLSLYAYELGIVAMFYNEAPYLEEWIEYHHMSGVDHFWLCNHGSTDDWEEVLAPYVRSGLVEVTYRPQKDGMLKKDGTEKEFDWWVPLQHEVIQEGIREAKGIARWVAIIDVDEFIIPKRHLSIPECLDQQFRSTPAIFVNWRHFGTSGVTISAGDPTLFKLTKCSQRDHPRNFSGKTIVRPESVLINKIWNSHFFPLKRNLKYENGDGNQIDWNGNWLLTGDQHHDDFLVINHYALRDEHFYKNVRLKRRTHENRKKYWEVWYKSYSETEDFTIINFIRENHPEMHKGFWKN